jgi:hypothetical protein
MKTLLAAILLVIAEPALADQPPPSERSSTWDVWVFKLIDGQWVKQDDRGLKTNDLKEARDYYRQILRYPGWFATSNAPGFTPSVVSDVDRAAIDARYIAALVDNADLAFHGPLEYSPNANDPVKGYNTLHRPGVNYETPVYCGPYGCYVNGYYGRTGYYRH